MNDKSAPSNTWINPLHVHGDRAQRIAGALSAGNRLRERVNAGWALGTFLIELPTPATVTALSLAGFDFVVLDMEHSSIGFAALEGLIGAGHAAGIPVLVRTWETQPGLVGKVLDMGANGIMAPHVDTPERARAIVDQARFKPRGNRGFSPLTKFDALESPLEALDEATFVVVQIEGRKALEGVGEIASVPGVDAVFVGPYDLALSLGVPPASPEVYEAAGRIAESVADSVALGIYIDDPETAADWADRRFALQCVSFDGRMLANGARSVASRARQAVTPGRREG